jgi:ubiquinone/menaquinone biosynthesis C-methylase UbiE
MPREDYIHGTSAVEQDRLSRLNRLLNMATLREMRLRKNERVLDVGSGLGQLTRMMAKRVGKGRVLGIERDSRQLATARKLARADREEDQVEFRRGEAPKLPLRASEWGRFDVVHTRFLLEHVTDPLSVVRAMVKAARPGGRIILCDDDHELMHLHPEVPGFVPLWAAYMAAYDRAGKDPLVGRKLVELLHSAGAQPRRNTSVFFGACAGSSRFAPLVTNLIEVLQGARGPVIEGGFRDFDDVIATLRSWGTRADAAIWYGMNWAEGRKSE